MTHDATFTLLFSFCLLFHAIWLFASTILSVFISFYPGHLHTYLILIEMYNWGPYLFICCCLTLGPSAHVYTLSARSCWLACTKVPIIVCLTSLAIRYRIQYEARIIYIYHDHSYMIAQALATLRSNRICLGHKLLLSMMTRVSFIPIATDRKLFIVG
jgi:hypothetical protein